MPTVNTRTILWLLLVAVLFLNYEMWQRDYPPVPVLAGVGNAVSSRPLDATAPTVPPPASAAPAATNSTGAGAALGATAPSLGTSAADVRAAAANESAAAVNGPPGGVVHVVTDVLDLDIGLTGGELQRADLPKYPIAKDQPNVPVRLLNRDGPETLFVLQSGLAGAPGEEAPTHLAVYHAQQEARLGAAANELRVPLIWTDAHGVTVTKTFSFRRGEYAIGLEYRIENGAQMPWSFAPYTQILRNNPPVETSMFHVDSYAFKGPAIYDGTRYQKLNFAKGATLNQDVRGGWIAALQYHFVAADVPGGDAPYRYELKSQGNQFLLSATGPSQTVAPGASTTVRETLFVGPKLQAQLEQAGPRLELVTDYGRLALLAKPLFWLLERVHSLVGNWGFAIIIVTFLLKLLFYPLLEISGRSMAKMKELGPRMNNLRETYKDDREKLNRAMMELYQREKINPLAGCLPMLIQMPVLLAFYWVLRDSVEIRQAPFIGWITDLSSRDPYFILPAVMAGANFLQFKLNPQMGDPAQQKIMMFMPIAMSVMFAFFPAGLVLYWVTSTLLGILQQWHINRRIAASAARTRS